MMTEENYRSSLPFTIHMSVVLEEIMHAAQRKDIVSRAVGETIVTGIAVSIGDTHGNPQPHADVRDLYLRVKYIDDIDGYQNLEQYWPVSALMADAASGRFAAGRW